MRLISACLALLCSSGSALCAELIVRPGQLVACDTLDGIAAVYRAARDGSKPPERGCAKAPVGALAKKSTCDTRDGTEFCQFEFTNVHTKEKDAGWAASDAVIEKRAPDCPVAIGTAERAREVARKASFDPSWPRSAFLARVASVYALCGHTQRVSATLESLSNKERDNALVLVVDALFKFDRLERLDDIVATSNSPRVRENVAWHRARRFARKGEAKAAFEWADKGRICGTYHMLPAEFGIKKDWRNVVRAVGVVLANLDQPDCSIFSWQVSRWLIATGDDAAMSKAAEALVMHALRSGAGNRKFRMERAAGYYAMIGQIERGVALLAAGKSAGERDETRRWMEREAALGLAYRGDVMRSILRSRELMSGRAFFDALTSIAAIQIERQDFSGARETLNLAAAALSDLPASEMSLQCRLRSIVAMLYLRTHDVDSALRALSNCWEDENFLAWGESLPSLLGQIAELGRLDETHTILNVGPWSLNARDARDRILADLAVAHAYFRSEQRSTFRNEYTVLTQIKSDAVLVHALARIAIVEATGELR